MKTSKNKAQKQNLEEIKSVNTTPSPSPMMYLGYRYESLKVTGSLRNKGVHVDKIFLLLILIIEEE